MREVSGRALALLAGVVVAFAASCGGGGGTGGAGGTSGGTAGSGPGGTGGSAGNAGGGTGGTTPSCSGCRTDQICVQGACMDLPGQCPCPVESYCDLSVNRCVAGCTRNEECSPARVCNVTARTCLDGCRDDASCGAGRICENYACRDGCRTQAACGTGFICLNMVCQAGCASTTDCTATGQTCVSNVCQCPAAQQACGGACTRVDTVMNCGTCGNACARNQVCMAGQCACPPGTCTPEVVYSEGKVDGFWLDGTYLYVLDALFMPTGTIYTMRRKPIAGGAVELVGQLTDSQLYDSPQVIKVAGGQVLWTVETSGSASGALYALATGTARRQLDSYPNPGSLTVAHDGTNAYWWHYPRTGTGRTGQLYQITIGTIARRMLATDAEPGLTVIQGSTLYFYNGDGRIRSYNLNSGGTTLSALRPANSANWNVGIAVDSAGHYLCERTGTSSANGTQVVVRLALNGTGMTTLATETGYPTNCWITPSDTHVYYYGWDYKALKRVPKAGGAVETVISDPAAGFRYLAIGGGYVYYGSSPMEIRRIATTYSP